MKEKWIKYKGGYKYQLVRDYGLYTNIFPKEDIHSEFISLYTDSYMLIRYKYAWDGASGPAIDTKTIMRGSLVHDAICQLIREEHLPRSVMPQGNALLKRICLEDGMCKIRAWWVHRGVNDFGDFAGDPKNKKAVLTAP